LFNLDFKDMLLALSDAKIDFLLVGAYAVAAHGHLRATGDLDLWVRPDAETAPKVYRVLADFGAPLHDLTVDDLATWFLFGNLFCVATHFEFRVKLCRKNLPSPNCANLSAVFFRVKRSLPTLKNIVCAKIVPSSKLACHSASVISLS